MAGDKAVKAKKAKSGGGSVMGLLSKLLAVMSILAGGALLAGLYDTMHFGLGEMLHGMSIVPVSIYALGGILALLLAPRSAAVTAAAADQGRLEALGEFQSKAAARFSALQNQIDALSGNDHAALMEENKALKAELDAIHEAEREKADGAMEALRLRNEELERQIREWASEAVGRAVKGEDIQPMKAA